VAAHLSLQNDLLMPTGIVETKRIKDDQRMEETSSSSWIRELSLNLISPAAGQRGDQGQGDSSMESTASRAS